MPKSRTTAPNKGELAKSIPCTRQTLDRLFKLPGHPQPRLDGRHDIIAWRRFYAENRTAHNAKPLNGNGSNGHLLFNEREQSIIEKNRIAAMAAKFDLDVKMGEFIRRIDVNRDIDTANAIIKRELVKLMQHILPPKLEGLKAAEIVKVGMDELNRVLKSLPGHFEKAASGTG